MLHDKRITKLFDFADSRECFSAADIAGGLCYFLWDSNANGPCLVTNVAGMERVQVTRDLDGFGEIFRHQSYIEIGSGALLSRATAGVYKKCCIFSMPGSPNAVKTALNIIIDELPHIVHHAKK